MTLNGWIQIAAFFLVLLVLVKPLGLYMARVYLGHPHPLLTTLGPLERVLYRLCGIHPDREMEWTTYAFAILLFSGIGMAFVYSLQRLQALLPLNPRHLGSVPPALAFNTAASYVTNTNWQAYSGEATMSHLIQMLALTSQDFSLLGHRGCRITSPCSLTGSWKCPDHRKFLGRPRPHGPLRPAAHCR